MPTFSRLPQPVLIGLIALVLVATVSGVIGYGLGSNRAIHVVPGNQGWLLQSTATNGVVAPVAPNGEIFLWWNIAQTPHNIQADWFVMTLIPTILTPLPKSKKPPEMINHLAITDVKVDAASNGQGMITVIAISNINRTVITGTLTTTAMTLILPPSSDLYPNQINEFRTLTFVPSTIDAFNQLVVQNQ